MTRICTVLTLAAAALLAGCGIEPPKNYLEIASGPNYDHRYLSAGGNVLATRTVSNPKGGTLDFWTEAIRKELVDSAGYTLTGEPQKIGSGSREGRLFDFRTKVGDAPHTYLLAVYVSWSRVTLIEAAGQSDKIEADRKKLLEAMQG